VETWVMQTVTWRHRAGEYYFVDRINSSLQKVSHQ